MGRAIGIDLGTTNSCVAIIENGQPVIVPSRTGARTTPSIVAFTKNGERLIGDVAKRQLATNGERTITSVKRHMGTDWTTMIDGKMYKPQTISSMVLQQLKEDAESFAGAAVTDAVITVPAYFNDAQRQATKDAGKIAGLNVLRIINEPTSAALSYGLNHGESQKVMVYDLGGGTFDVSIIEIEDGVIEVLATAGDNHLGGDDFDARIKEWIIREFKTQNKIDLGRDITAIYRIQEAAEKAKIELSTAEMTNINLPYIAQHRGEPLHLDLMLSRAKYQELIYDLVERTVGPVQQALSDAQITARDLDTGKEQSITITANDRMSDAEIEQAMRDAQQYAGVDSLRREALELLDDANRLLAKTQQSLKDAGKNIEKQDKKQIKADISALQKCVNKLRVDTVTQEQIDALKDAKAALEISSVRVLNKKEER